MSKSVSRPTLFGFGLGKQSKETGTAAGTLAWMAPELIEGARATEETGANLVGMNERARTQRTRGHRHAVAAAAAADASRMPSVNERDCYCGRLASRWWGKAARRRRGRDARPHGSGNNPGVFPNSIAAYFLSSKRTASCRFHHSADVFAFGVVLYEICARRVPFAEVADSSSIAPMIRQGKRPALPATLVRCEEMEDLHPPRSQAATRH